MKTFGVAFRRQSFDENKHELYKRATLSSETMSSIIPQCLVYWQRSDIVAMWWQTRRLGLSARRISKPQLAQQSPGGAVAVLDRPTTK